MDLFWLGAGVAFFLGSWGLTLLCGRLQSEE
jgi:hypothetical protein